ncbi:MAG: hypothetical protein KIT73_19880, partial [Burkholderiales bacterium]|nr:hypothetical protein [Burkholderiales bacterium]
DVSFNLNFGGDLTHRIDVAAILVKPGYPGFRGIKPGGEHDIALVRLKWPVPPGVPVYGLFTNELPRGAILSFVGYGGSGNGDTGVSIGGNPAVKRLGQNVADCFAFTLGPDNCRMTPLIGVGPRALYLFDFDRPDGSNGPMGGPTLGATEATLAGGDSGSPAFVQISGQWRIAGVNTFVSNPDPKGKPGRYGSVGGGVLLAGENGEWVRAVIGPLLSRRAEVGPSPR